MTLTRTCFCLRLYGIQSIGIGLCYEISSSCLGRRISRPRSLCRFLAVQENRSLFLQNKKNHIKFHNLQYRKLKFDIYFFFLTIHVLHRLFLETYDPWPQRPFSKGEDYDSMFFMFFAILFAIAVKVHVFCGCGLLRIYELYAKAAAMLDNHLL